MNKYQKIIELISNSKKNVDFADYGFGVSEEWIKKAEDKLGFELPISYKWWLRNYNGGEIYGEEIYSIYQIDFETVVGGDIVYMYFLNLKNKIISENQLIVCHTDDDIYFFDMSQKNSDGDYSIFSMNTKNIYAYDFVEFLYKRITNQQLLSHL